MLRLCDGNGRPTVIALLVELERGETTVTPAVKQLIPVLVVEACLHKREVVAHEEL